MVMAVGRGGKKLLQELSIKNFAIIDQISVTFDKGLTVLTGETGAGKSIIIDSLHLLVGVAVLAEFVRHGEKKAEIEGLFYWIANIHAMLRLAEFGIDIEDGMMISEEIFPAMEKVSVE